MHRYLSTNGVCVMKYKLGRNRPRVRAPTLSLKNYLLATLPTPPPAVDYSKKPAAGLADILGNDENGNCTIACAFHISDTLIANANAPANPDLNAANAVALYYQLTGGQDSGLDETSVLNFWMDQGLGPDGAHKISGYVAIDPTNETEVQTALWLFENLYFGIELPDAYVAGMDTMENGFTWGVVGPPNPDNGHAFCGVGYSNKGITIDTWGLLGTMPFSAVGYYCSAIQGGQLFSVLGAEAVDVATDKVPSGFAWSQLLNDLQMFS